MPWFLELLNDLLLDKELFNTYLLTNFNPHFFFFIQWIKSTKKQQQQECLEFVTMYI